MADGDHYQQSCSDNRKGKVLPYSVRALGLELIIDFNYAVGYHKTSDS